jgi:hypothetical protein
LATAGTKADCVTIAVPFRGELARTTESAWRIAALPLH